MKITSFLALDAMRSLLIHLAKTTFTCGGESSVLLGKRPIH
uniref:Uncharacterized protein n=1 Tax=Romanomermis culicivorax TaxID=13658 RepID=A0A915KFQ7_ROMCU